MLDSVGAAIIFYAPFRKYTGVASGYFLGRAYLREVNGHGPSTRILQPHLQKTSTTVNFCEGVGDGFPK
jgi:hypothetical protein